MTAYKEYFYKVLHSINLIGDDSPPLRALPEISAGSGASRQAKTRPENPEKRPFNNDHPSVLPAREKIHLVEDKTWEFGSAAELKPPYSPFWFWGNNINDELALEFIREGDSGKAIAIWEKAILWKEKNKLTPAVFIDDLITGSSDWPEEKNEQHSLIKEGDAYIISRENKTGSSVPCIFADLNYQNNWTIEVNAEWLEGVDKYSYGIVFGRERNDYYSFVITGNGHFSLVKQSNGDYFEIIPWKKGFGINKCSANHLLLKKINDQISLYINHNYAGSVPSEPFFGKGFGFKVWGNQKISFSKFKFCKFIQEDLKFRVTEENYSCVKNLSMLYLGLATKNGGFHYDHFKKGIELAELFYTSAKKEGYAKLIEGEKYLYYPEKTLQFYLTEVVDSVKIYIDRPGGITTGDLIGLFSGFPVETGPIFNNIFFSNRIQKIDREIELTKAAKSNTAAGAADAGKKLVKNTREDVVYLRNSLGENSREYAAIADKLAHTIMQCGIDYYSQLFDVDYKLANSSIESYLPEHRYALNIAVSSKAKDSLKDVLNLYQKKIDEVRDQNVLRKGKRRLA